MARAATLLILLALTACSPCPAGTSLVEIPLSDTETEKVCRSEGGIMHGPYRRYVSGVLVQEGNYEFGDRTGGWVTYGPQGRMTALAEYRNDLKIGEWKTWSDGGTLLSEVTWNNGREHGPERRWHDNGQFAEKGGNVEGRRDGVFTEWHDNGQRKSERNFDLGVRDGAWTEWSRDGQLRVRGTYLEGERDGLWEEWYDNGRPRMRVEYASGVPGPGAAYWNEEGSPKAPVASGAAERADLAPYVLAPWQRPPDPRLAWAFKPPGDPRLGAPAEVRDTVVVPAGARLYALKANDPSSGQVFEVPENISAFVPVVEGDEAVMFTESGQLLVVRPTAPPGEWTVHQLDADLSVTPAVADPHVVFVGRDNRLRVYDRFKQQVRWSRPVAGEALEIGVAPDKTWVLSTAGQLVSYAMTDGAELVSSDFTSDGVRAPWTSRPVRGFLLYWWRGDILEAVRPSDGQVAFRWQAPDELQPERARLARVSDPRGDLGVFDGHRVYYLDSTRSGEVTATSETLTERPPAEFSSCISWGVLCVRADRDGRIAYPGGVPYLGSGLAAAPALGEERLWVSSDQGWLGRLNFEPAVEVDVMPLVPGQPDQDRLTVDGPRTPKGPWRKVRWHTDAGPGWEQVALDLGGDVRPGSELLVQVSLPVGRDQGWGPPVWPAGWVETRSAVHQEAQLRYRLFREVVEIDLPDLPADRLATILGCQDDEKVETSGTLVLSGTPTLGADPMFQERLEGTFRIGSAAFAKACAMVVFHQDPVTGAFRPLGAYGAPGRPLATTQRALLELHDTAVPRAIGTRAEPAPPKELSDVGTLRLVQESGFGPERVVEVKRPASVVIEDGYWVVYATGTAAVRVAMPEVALDHEVHAWEGHTYEVRSWEVKSPPLREGTHRVITLYRRTGTGKGLAAASAEGR